MCRNSRVTLKKMNDVKVVRIVTGFDQYIDIGHGLARVNTCTSLEMFEPGRLELSLEPPF